MEERVSIWNAGMTLFKQNPFWGGAPNLYAFLSSYFAPYHEHAQGIYIDTILSYGVVGTVLLGIASSGPIRMLIDMGQRPSKRPIVGLYLSFLTVVAVHGIFDLALCLDSILLHFSFCNVCFYH